MQPNCCKNENCDSQKRILCTIINSSGQAKFYFFFAKIGHVDELKGVCHLNQFAVFLSMLISLQYFSREYNISICCIYI